MELVIVAVNVLEPALVLGFRSKFVLVVEHTELSALKEVEVGDKIEKGF